ncbi:MAG TPA: hypothetical protein VN807_04900, partial [Candidatus Sulfotelmatobacter sp.]|nr:hypothetical protein [Candidatus Sulfotelmatobacter sp.]
GEDTINVIPEAWKFAPKQKGSPVRQSAEEMIREGAAMKNFLWIDSQDLAGVADVLMRQVGVWLFGVQRAKHEIERALDHMPEGLPARRPRPQDIATLSKGQFYVCFGREMHKVYVQPAWMTAAHAEAIARGEEEVTSAHEILNEFDNDMRRSEAVRTKNQAFTPGGYADGDATQVAAAASSSRRVNHSPEHESTARLAVETEEGTGSRVEDTDSLESDEETMWKERFEELKKQFVLLDEHDRKISEELIKLRQSLGMNKGEHTESEDHLIAGEMGEFLKRFPAASYESMYQYVRKRIYEDPNLCLETYSPELRVKIERPVVTADTKTLFGRMAQLVSEGFFNEVQGSRIATAEAVRRGWCHPKTPFMRVQDPLDKLTAMGFLTREAEGYKAVAGVKIKVEEA